MNENKLKCCIEVIKYFRMITSSISEEAIEELSDDAKKFKQKVICKIVYGNSNSTKEKHFILYESLAFLKGVLEEGKDDLDIIQEVYDILSFELKLLEQQMCCHPYWIFLEDVSDYYDEIYKYRCKCLLCEKEDEISPDDLRNKMFYYNSDKYDDSLKSLEAYFGELQEEYKKISYKSMNVSKELKNKIPGIRMY